jgi:hypothetical protein
MKVLTVHHDDFELTVECNNFISTFNHARSKQRNIFAATSYVLSDGIASLVNPSTGQLVEIREKMAPPVFFENKDYFVGVTFKNATSINKATFHSRLKEVQDKFFFRPEIGFLAGTINYGNDLGQSDLLMRYELGNQTKEFALHFEVFPTKLDYRNDFNRIVADIENEYPYLVLDFLRKTYSAFRTGTSPNTDLIWWQVFGGLYKEFIHAARFILNKPHNRIVKSSRLITADRLIRWTTRLEEEFHEFKHAPKHSYLSDYKILSTNTPENRFFKYAVFQTLRRYARVREFITRTFSTQISEGFRAEMVDIGNQMEVISNHPFFKSVSEFTGIKQESLVLNKASGYSTIYRCWVMLNSGLSFLEGIQRIELKNIADLYQIWCFLEIKGILQKLLGKERPDNIELAEIQIDDFVFRFEKGAKSRVSYRQPNGDLIDLFHDFSYAKGQNQEVRSFTVTQRPDIVLRITRNDLKNNYIFTYLYDAKYRLQSDDNPLAADSPPDDALNQMHRYRDAIYYLNREKNKPEKEVIGAYILFPGSGSVERVRNADYYRSIEFVNIGAFPLRPNDTENRIFLEDHLANILSDGSDVVLGRVSPQKRMSYETTNPFVLVGFVRPDSYAPCFMRENPFYYTGNRKPRHVGRSDLRYFAPYRTGIGITDYYEILEFSFMNRNLIEGIPGSEDNSERMIIVLGKRTALRKPVRPMATPNPYVYTTLSFLRNPNGDRIETFPSGYIRRTKEASARQ